MPRRYRKHKQGGGFFDSLFGTNTNSNQSITTIPNTETDKPSYNVNFNQLQDVSSNSQNNNSIDNIKNKEYSQPQEYGGDRKSTRLNSSH